MTEKMETALDVLGMAARAFRARVKESTRARQEAGSADVTRRTALVKQADQMERDARAALESAAVGYAEDAGDAEVPRAPAAPLLGRVYSIRPWGGSYVTGALVALDAVSFTLETDPGRWSSISRLNGVDILEGGAT